MRDRLIELLKNHCEYVSCIGKQNVTNCNDCLIGGVMADYLIENGVIVPPCKVGDTVFSFDEFYKRITEFQVTGIEIVVSCKSLRGGLHAFSLSSFGKTLFHQREAAEQALKEREQG